MQEFLYIKNILFVIPVQSTKFGRRNGKNIYKIDEYQNKERNLMAHVQRQIQAMCDFNRCSYIFFTLYYYINKSQQNTAKNKSYFYYNLLYTHVSVII